MNGRLAEHPPAELIHEITDARLSGALRLAREHAKAAVYFEAGAVVAALSNLRALRLVEVLRRGGGVEEARLSALGLDGVSDEQAAITLLRTHLIDEAALNELQERRTRAVLRELLRWMDGEWSFDPRVRLAHELHGERVDASALLVEAARTLPAAFVCSRVHDGETLAPAGDVQQQMGGALRLLPAEAFLLSRLSGPLRVGEVVSLGGLPEEETRRAVYVLALGGLLERPGRTRAIRPEAAGPAAQRAATSVPVTRPPQEPARPPAESAPAGPKPEPDTPGTVEELLARARGATHYEVLGVPRTATAEEVKRVYYSHARRLHPDRFRRDADEELRQRTDAAFARIAQAYDTLKDAALRAAYDLKLSKQSRQ